MAKLFSTRTLFFALSVTIYGLGYGLRSPTKEHGTLIREQPKPISAGIIERLKESATQIRNEDIPARILKAVRGTTSDASERKALIRFLVGKDNDPCRNLD